MSRTSINILTEQWAKENQHLCFYYPEITSTNDVAKAEFSNQKKDFALYLADHQSQGRGRNENVWHNLSQGEVLLSTWCYHLEKSPQPIITPLLGLALYESLKKLDNNLPLRLKPPNDIYLGTGKLSGLLVEVSQLGSDHFLSIGLGLNAFAAPTVDLKTASLSQHLEVTNSSWFAFCTDLHQNFTHAIKKGQNAELTAQDQAQLLTALNSGLAPEEQYSQVSPRCDLYTATGLISWMDL